MDGLIRSVRRAQPGDESGIASVHVDTWRDTYRGIIPADYLNSLAADERRTALWLSQINDLLVSVHVAVDAFGPKCTDGVSVARSLRQSSPTSFRWDTEVCWFGC